MHNQKRKKYIVILGDGMSDWGIEKLGGKTPLEYADTPTFDYLAKRSVIGLARTTPDGMSPGSDIANLSVFGYDPKVCHTGRSPLEAASLGIDLKQNDHTFRLNFVTLSEEEPYDQKTLLDYSAGEISSAESAELIKALNEHFQNDELSFYPGTSYRNILLWHDCPGEIKLTPPHDISGKKISDYLPENRILYTIMEKSYEILKDHPVNQKRMELGKNPGNSAWFWGQGKKTNLTDFLGKYGVKGCVISAVDLVKGIAVSANMDVLHVDNITGTVHTNFEGKAEMAVKALKDGYDFIYIHMEAPDESGHQGSLEDKITSIEKIDMVTKYIYDELKKDGYDFRMLISPDHATPLKILTHSREPVPFLLFDSRYDGIRNEKAGYNEKYARSAGLFVEKGHDLMDYLLGKKTFS